MSSPFVLPLYMPYVLFLHEISDVFRIVARDCRQSIRTRPRVLSLYPAATSNELYE